jgi:hypothetical protein
VAQSTELDERIRLAVLREFVRTGSPPTVEHMMGELRLSREEIERGLERLDETRHLKLLPGTHRILMAFPFSAIATPYSVVLRGNQRYFANCAWDSIAFYPVLHKPIHVESFCYHCGRALSFELRADKVKTGAGAPPVIYLGRPAAEWWTDIITTCSNTMLFFASSEHLQQWRDSHPDTGGVELPIETVLKLSGPLYAGKMSAGFTRPSHDRMIQLFRELNLTGEFWRI